MSLSAPRRDGGGVPARLPMGGARGLDGRAPQPIGKRRCRGKVGGEADRPQSLRGSHPRSMATIASLPAAGFLYWVGALSAAYVTLRAGYCLVAGLRVWVLGRRVLPGPGLGAWAGECGAGPCGWDCPLRVRGPVR